MTDLRRAQLLAYCKLTEFEADPEVQALLETFYIAAVSYMAQAGISCPPEGTARRMQYDLAVNYMVLNSWDNRETTFVSTAAADNPVFRQMIVQLKLTEPRNVSKSDTSEEEIDHGKECRCRGAADPGILPEDPQGER